jgi:hypothetical protein
MKPFFFLVGSLIAVSIVVVLVLITFGDGIRFLVKAENQNEFEQLVIAGIMSIVGLQILTFFIKPSDFDGF